MQQYKFRIYDPIDKSLTSDISLYKIASQNTHEDFKDLEGNLRKDLIIEQYTGLQDKNGVDIYEGDIIKLQGDCGCVQPRVVEFSQGEFTYVIRSKQAWKRVKNPIVLYVVEIIGNIHYNEPELYDIIEV